MTAGDEATLVARVWRLTDGDLSDPVTEQVLRTMTVPRAERLPGYLGTQVLVGDDGHALHGASYWDSAESELASREFGVRALEALQSLTSARAEGPTPVEVVLSSFHGVLDPTAAAVGAAIVVCTTRLAGPGTGGPQALAELEAELIGHLGLPGCVGVLLLHAPDGPAVVAQTFWDGTPASTIEVSSVEHFQVLVNHPVAWSTTAPRVG